MLHRIRHLALRCKLAAGGIWNASLLAAMVLVTIGLGNALASDANRDRLGGWLFAEAHLEALEDALERAAEAIHRGAEADALVIMQRFIGDERLGSGQLAEVQTWLGYLLLRRGQAALAESYFRRAAAADPERVAAWAGSGDVRVHRRAFAEAREHYVTAAALAPEAAVLHYRLGATSSALGDCAEAKAAFETAVALNPPAPIKALADNGLAFVLATCADQGLRDAGRALAIIEPMANAFPVASFRRTRALALASAGRLAEALEEVDSLAAELGDQLGNLPKLEEQLTSIRSGRPWHGADGRPLGQVCAICIRPGFGPSERWGVTLREPAQRHVRRIPHS